MSDRPGPRPCSAGQRGSVVIWGTVRLGAGPQSILTHVITEEDIERGWYRFSEADDKPVTWRDEAH